ncbi:MULTISPECIES: class I SAM-dependent methyltransferase [Bradyrhizobium]|uniref:class I SAM-dependent methyltransferase n=1 Tax=Bradyrhizobium TaxID=374 RepID=UPI001EDC5BF8|nr:class I SAM-dependent methyltransferase [Bradyrhizobium zhengyangense]MCG2645407.1 class I SAM-dependent methyltransferase [Bradyrhizobium zhengyangense]
MNYYHFVRREIEPLLPPNPTRILEVGAGAGGTLKWLKAQNPGAETTAVELNSELREELTRNVDVALIGPIEEVLPALKTYDLILLLDVLEHLTDSVGVLRKLSSLLVPGGHVIVSVPNIAHLSVSLPLLLTRRFTYQDSGILDRTHLRFFVESTAVKLLNDASLTVTAGLMSGMQGPRARLINMLSLGGFQHHLAKQYIMLGQQTAGQVSQPPVDWKIAK